MTTRSQGPYEAATTAPPEAPHDGAPHPAPAKASVCAREQDAETACPSCGTEMRLWANYYRCRTCGYKESCCF